MTIDDAMKALAEALEPMPKRAHGLSISERGFWYWNDSSVTMDLAAHPFDFLHSENASVRLIAAMRQEHHVFVCYGATLNYTAVILMESLAAPFGIDEFVDHPGYFEKTLRVKHQEPLTAVFLAALAWKGIERPEGLK